MSPPNLNKQGPELSELISSSHWADFRKFEKHLAVLSTKATSLNPGSEGGGEEKTQQQSLSAKWGQAGVLSALLTTESFLLLLPKGYVALPVFQKVVLRRWDPGRMCLLFFWGFLLWLFFSRDEGHQTGRGVYQLGQLKRAM